jgi:hypothetical protein
MDVEGGGLWPCVSSHSRMWSRGSLVIVHRDVGGGAAGGRALGPEDTKCVPSAD